MLRNVRATAAEVREPRAGDELVPHPDVVMNRGFSLAKSPEVLWPWLVQLGKRRAGWYLPGSVERFVPPARRAARRIEPGWQSLKVGDVVPDYGGAHETLQVAIIEPPTTLVYQSWRGQLHLSWAITLTPEPEPEPELGPSTGGQTRIHLRLRLGPVVHQRLATTVGELFDLLTIAGMAAGLRERLTVADG